MRKKIPFFVNYAIESMDQIEWSDCEKVQILAGTIVEVEAFPDACKPAYKLKIDLGPVWDVKKLSAQITKLYSKEELKEMQVVCMVNFKPRQSGPFISEILKSGFILEDEMMLAIPAERVAPNGTRLA